MGDGVDGKYTIDAGEKLVRVQVWGELRATGLIKLMGRIASDPHYQGDMDAVIDLREAHGNWDSSEIQRLRDYVARIGGTAQRRWAAVVAPGSLVAAARVLIVISEPVAGSIRMQLFDDMPSALAWVRGGRREERTARSTAPHV